MILDQKYQIVKFLSKGGFGEVYKIEENIEPVIEGQRRRIFACKVELQSKSNSLIKEAKILEGLREIQDQRKERILPIYEKWEERLERVELDQIHGNSDNKRTKSVQYSFLVLEYVGFKNLNSIKPYEIEKLDLSFTFKDYVRLSKNNELPPVEQFKDSKRSCPLRIGKYLISILQKLHLDYKVIHKDIKPHNFVLHINWMKPIPSSQI